MSSCIAVRIRPRRSHSTYGCAGQFRDWNRRRFAVVSVRRSAEKGGYRMNYTYEEMAKMAGHSLLNPTLTGS